MARIVGRPNFEPYKLVIGGGEKYLCRCGGKTFWYDDAGSRHESTADFRGLRTL